MTEFADAEKRRLLDVGGPDGAETRAIHTAAMKGYVRGSTAGVSALDTLGDN